jgi:hypothetical protein
MKPFVSPPMISISVLNTNSLCDFHGRCHVSGWYFSYMFRRQSARTGDTGRGVRSEDQRLAEVFFGCGGNGTSMSIVRRVVGYAVVPRKSNLCARSVEKNVEEQFGKGNVFCFHKLKRVQIRWF